MQGKTIGEHSITIDLDKSLAKQQNLNSSKYTSRNSKQESTVNAKTKKIPIKTVPTNHLRTAYQNFVKTAVCENKKPHKKLCLMKSNDENLEAKRENLIETPGNKTFTTINENTTSRLQQCMKQYLNCTVIRKEVKSVLGDHQRNSLPKSTHGTFIKTQRKSEVNQKPKVFKGSFNLLCTSMHPPLEIIEETIKGLNLHKIKYKKTQGYLLTCQKQAIKFEIEVMQMEPMHVLRFKRLEGNTTEYKITCSKLLSSIKL